MNIEAAVKMGELHNRLREIGYSDHHLELYLVRLTFCLARSSICGRAASCQQGPKPQRKKRPSRPTPLPLRGKSPPAGWASEQLVTIQEFESIFTRRDERKRLEILPITDENIEQSIFGRY